MKNDHLSMSHVEIDNNIAIPETLNHFNILNFTYTMYFPFLFLGWMCDFSLPGEFLNSLFTNIQVNTYSLVLV